MICKNFYSSCFLLKCSVCCEFVCIYLLFVNYYNHSSLMQPAVDNMLHAVLRFFLYLRYLYFTKLKDQAKQELC